MRCGMKSCEILGTSITCTTSFIRISISWSTVCGTGSSRIFPMGAKSASCSTVYRWTRSCGTEGSARLAGRLPQGSSSNELKSTGWRRGASGTSRVLQLEPPPRPWPSSGAVRCGAETWPWPQRSTAACVATTSAVVAACAAEQLQKWAAR